MTTIGFRPTITIPSSLRNNTDLVRELQDIQNRHLQDAIQRGQHYPPPPARSKYKRTFVLRDSWHMNASRLVGDTLRGSIYNNAQDPRGRRYPSYVFGSTQYAQAEVHQGRWPTHDQLFDRASYIAESRAAIARRFG